MAVTYKDYIRNKRNKENEEKEKTESTRTPSSAYSNLYAANQRKNNQKKEEEQADKDERIRLAFVATRKAARAKFNAEKERTEKEIGTVNNIVNDYSKSVDRENLERGAYLERFGYKDAVNVHDIYTDPEFSTVSKLERFELLNDKNKRRNAYREDATQYAADALKSAYDTTARMRKNAADIDKNAEAIDKYYGAGTAERMKKDLGMVGQSAWERSKGADRSKDYSQIVDAFGGEKGFKRALEKESNGWSAGVEDPENLEARQKMQRETEGRIAEINQELDDLDRATYDPTYSGYAGNAELGDLEERRKALTEERDSLQADLDAYNELQGRIDAGDRTAIEVSKLRSADADDRYVQYVELSSELQRIKSLIDSGKNTETKVSPNGQVYKTSSDAYANEEYITADGEHTGMTNQEALEYYQAQLLQYERSLAPTDRYASLLKDYDTIVNSEESGYNAIRARKNDVDRYLKLQKNGERADYNAGIDPNITGDTGLGGGYWEMSSPDTHGEDASLLVRGQTAYWDNFTEDELKVIRALWGMGRKDEAYQFINDMAPILGKRELQKSEDWLANDASTLDKVFASVAGVAQRTVGGIPAFVEDVALTAAGMDTNPYSYLHQAQNQGQAIEAQVAADIDEAMPNLNFFGLSAGQVYQGIQSGIDSGVSRALFGKGSVVAMAMGAASSEAKELWEKGATREQIAVGASIAGIAEALFEYVSLEMAFKNFMESTPTSKMDFIKKALIQMGVEGSEEVFTDIANLMGDAFNMNTQSEWAQYIKKYTDQGYSEAEAFGMAMWNDVISGKLWESFLGGALGTVFSTGGNFVQSLTGTYATGANIKRSGVTDNFMQYANEVALQSPRSTVQESLEKAQANPSKMNLGFLAMAVNQEMVKQSEADVDQALKENGIDSKTAKKVKNAFMSIVNDSEYELTDEEQQLLEDERVWNAYNQVFGEEGAVTERNNAYQEAFNPQAEAEAEEVEEPAQLQMLGEEGQRAIQEIRSRGGNVADAHLAYLEGYNGYNLNATQRNIATTADQQLAYNAGRQDALYEQKQLHVEPVERLKSAEAVVNTVKGLYGKTAVNKNAGLIQDENYKKANLSREKARMLNGIGLAVGTQIRFGENLTNERGQKVNALYDPNTSTITISTSVKNPVEAALGHEIVHRIRNVSEEAYTSLRDFVTRAMGDEKMQWAIGRREAPNWYNTKDENGFITEEVVADAVGYMFSTDKNLQERLAKEFASMDKKPLQKILDVIRDVIYAIKTRLSGKYKTLSKNQKAEFENLQKNLQAMENAIVTALKEAEARIQAQQATEEVAEDLANGDLNDATRYSIVAFADAIGFTAEEDEETGERTFYTPSGDIATKVTREDILGSPVGALISYSQQNGILTKEEASAQVKLFQDIGNLAVKNRDFNMTITFVGSSVFTGLKSNADKIYNTTYDFSPICIKTQAAIDQMSAAMVGKGGALTEEEILDIYRRCHDVGLPVPCPECYVWNRWVGVGGLLDNIKTYQDRYGKMTVQEVRKAHEEAYRKIREYALEIGETFGKAKSKLIPKLTKQYTKLRDAIEIAENKGEEIKKKDREKLATLEKAMQDCKAVMWIENVYFANDKSLTKRNERFKVPDEILFDLNKGGEFSTQYPEAWNFRLAQGAAYGKAITPPSDANLGEGILGTNNVKTVATAKAEGTLKNPFLESKGVLTEDAKKALEKATKKQAAQRFKGGQRLNSTSDASPDMALNYLIAMLELQSMDGGAQIYTKVNGAVEALTAFGAFVNQSLMPKDGGIDENGNLLDTSVGGMNVKVAMENREKYDRAGTITIGLNDKHIRALFNARDRDQTIPYHASGGKATMVAEMRRIQESGEEKPSTPVRSTDYTTTQSEKWLSAAAMRARGDSADQIDLAMRTRQARLAILTRKGNVDMDLVRANPILSDLYDTFNGGEWSDVTLTKTDANANIYPNEFWDTTVDYDNSGVNTQRYLDYCESMGVLHKFSGKVIRVVNEVPTIRQAMGYDEKGNRVPLTDLAYKNGVDGSEGIEDFYWKSLTDHRMYGNDGAFLPHVPIRLSGVTQEHIEQFAKNNVGRQYNKTKSQSLAEQTREDYKKKYGVRESIVSPEENERYMELAQKPEENEAQLDQMVYDASRKAGFNTPKLYHGTNAFGFESFDLDYMDDGASIFATTDPNVAESYTGETTQRKMSDVVSPDALSGEALLDYAKKRRPEDWNGWRLVSQKERDQELSQLRTAIKNFRDSLTQAALALKDRFPDFTLNLSEARSIYEQRYNEAYNAENELAPGEDTSAVWEKRDAATAAEIILDLTKALDDLDKLSTTKDRIEALELSLDFDNRLNIPYDMFYKRAHSLGLDTLTLADFRELRALLNDDDLYVAEEGEYTSTYISGEGVRNLLKRYSTKGIYSLYGKAENPLVIDCNGREWHNIRLPLEMRDYAGQTASTRVISNWARNHGYDSVILKNLVDAGGHTKYREASDVYIFFNTNAVKSADPVTYDDRGPIPLSERFNTDTDRLRYSLVPVEEVKPTSDNWSRTMTAAEVRRLHPDLWASSNENADASNKKGNSTQTTSTTATYEKIFKHLKNTGFTGKILDASSGLGLGTKLGRDQYGLDVEDIEPYPGKGYTPMYTDYSTLHNQYPVVISNAVLNVLAQDERDAMVAKIGELLAPGGTAYINVRTREELKGNKTAEELTPGQAEYFVNSNKAYQKGFTRQELLSYLEDALGPGFTVQRGAFGSGSNAIITKDVNAPRESIDYREILDQQIKQYGKIRKGENPYRDIELPKQTERTKKVSKVAQTVLEAKVTPDKMVPTIKELVAKGAFSFESITDKDAMDRAKQKIDDDGFADAYSNFLKQVNRGFISKDTTAMGWALYDNAATAGDTKAALAVLRAMVVHQRTAAQALQASRILKQMSPEMQLYNFQKSLDDIIERVKKKYKLKNLQINPLLAEQFLAARSDEERDLITRQIYADIADQLPSKFTDRLRAWRYLCMLGNPKTHFRNILGNALFAPIVMTKNAIATGIEGAIYKMSHGKLNRTKAWLTGKQGRELYSAAWFDYKNVQDQALGEGKYNDEGFNIQEIDKRRQYFNKGPVKAWNKTGGFVLEKMRWFNNKALDVEDVWFNRPAYAFAMAQYCKANHISPEQIQNGKGLDAAREYAIKEAQKATYRDTNVLSDLFTRLGRVSTKNKRIAKAGSLLVEGILPFRKTPANILARGLEYSPLGLLKSLTSDLYRVKQGEISGAEAIDNIASGLTGTMLVALGMFFASMRLIKGHKNEKKKKEKYEKDEGHQQYSMEIGDMSFTLDWVAPESIPFFLGVNFYEAITGGDKGLSMDEIAQVVGRMSEPLIALSCLSGVNDAIEDATYALQGGESVFTAIPASAATSYLLQYFPTDFGQWERVFEDKRYITLADKNQWISGDVQRAIGQAANKIPGVEYGQVPYIDGWGREETTGEWWERLLNNKLNPANVKKINETKMDDELIRLSEYIESKDNNENDTSVFPTQGTKKITVDKKDVNFTSEQYVAYNSARGAAAYEAVGSLIESAGYKNLSDDDKIKVINSAYSYSADVGRMAIMMPTDNNWTVEAYEGVQKYNIPIGKYLLVRQKVNSCGGDETSLLKMKAIYDSGLTDRQCQYLINCESFRIGKTVKGFNRAKVNEELNKK